MLVFFNWAIFSLLYRSEKIRFIFLMVLSGSCMEDKLEPGDQLRHEGNDPGGGDVGLGFRRGKEKEYSRFKRY